WLSIHGCSFTRPPHATTGPPLTKLRTFVAPGLGGVLRRPCDQRRDDGEIKCVLSLSQAFDYLGASLPGRENPVAAPDDVVVPAALDLIKSEPSLRAEGSREQAHDVTSLREYHHRSRRESIGAVTQMSRIGL